MKNTNQSRLRYGIYTVILTLVFLAIVVFVNLMVRTLPSRFTKLDTSAASYYALSEQSIELTEGISEDVTVYLIAEGSDTDTVISELIARYASYNGKIKIRQVDPAFSPTFTAAYTEDTLAANSLIIESKRRYRVVNYSDIYRTETTVNYETYQQESTTVFNGEGAISGALRYVTAESIPVLYTTANHEELNFPESLATALDNNGYTCLDLDLSQGEIPADCSCLLINAPSTDFSESEVQAITAYLSHGGKVLFISPIYSESAMPDLTRLMSDCGATWCPGVISEKNADFYMSGYPILLTPKTEDSPILRRTGSGILTVTPYAHGIIPSGAQGWTYTPLLTTSEAAVLQVTEQTSDTETVGGQFQVAAMMTNTGGGSVLWFATPYIQMEQVDVYASGGNTEFLLASLDVICDMTGSASIPTKSTKIAAVSMTDAASTLWVILLVVLVPILILGAGGLVWWRRRRR